MRIGSDPQRPLLSGREAAVFIVTALAMGLGVAQLIPVRRTNPRVAGDVAAPPPVESILRRACYDCHSSETRWPWYSYVAPVSWVIVNHVDQARRQVNFSEWSGYYPGTQRRKLQWIGRALHEEQMPPWYYTLTHSDARLTAADREQLENWIESALTPTSNK